MILSTVEKLAISAVILAGIVFGLYRLDQSRQRIGYDRAVAEYNVALIAAKEDAKAQEVAWQSVIKDEQRKTNDALNKRDADYAALSRTADGLRGTIANLGNGLSTITATACSARISALSAVSNECADALAEMARHAEGERIDSVACRSQWPQ